MFAEKLAGIGFLQSVSYIKSIPTHEKNICGEKKVAQLPPYNLVFLGLGWPWVGEFVGFMIICTRYMFSSPTEFGIANTPFTYKVSLYFGSE